MARFDELPKEVVSEYGKKGCVKSAEVRREKRRMKESLNILLQMPLKRGQDVDIEEIKSFAQLKGKNITVEQAMLIAQIQRALKGDTNAIKFLREASGQGEEEW